METDTAITELAEASRIRLLSSDEYNPYKAHAFRTGEFIIEAIAKGVQTIHLMFGGSATLDGELAHLKLK